MLRSILLAGARALLRFTRDRREASAFAQKGEYSPVGSTKNGAASTPIGPTAFDVGQEIRTVLGDAAAVSRRVRLEIAVLPELMLRADRADFHRSLAGVVQHACSQPLVSRVLVTASRSGEWIEVTISDDGIGADLESRQQALWQIECLIAQQGGSLAVASWPDQGTLVLTRWPEDGPATNRPGRVPSAARERAPTG